MLSHVYCASTIGVDARLIEVEVHRTPGGMPKYFLVGLPDRAVNEATDRIEAALKNSNFKFPAGRITINLAPADVPKEGSAFDLPIAVTLLHVSGQVITNKLDSTLILGELALDGKLRSVNGVLPMAVQTRKQGLENMIVPAENGEAAVVDGIDVYSFEHITEVIEWLRDTNGHAPMDVDVQEMFRQNGEGEILDFSDVRGQQNVKRALEVAAAVR